MNRQAGVAALALASGIVAAGLAAQAALVTSPMPELPAKRVREFQRLHRNGS